jgi:hypothetical protein
MVYGELPCCLISGCQDSVGIKTCHVFKTVRFSAQQEALEVLI